MVGLFLKIIENYTCTLYLSPLGDADLDIHPHSALPSLFTRAFHSRPTQPSASDLLEQTSILNRLLPQQHPCLVHRTDYHIHHATPQTPGGGPNTLQNATTSSTTATAASAMASSTGGSRGNETDPQQPENAMQQLLTNISAATGSSELLAFGVGGSTSGAQRTRTSQSGTSSGSGSGPQAQTIDDGLESTTIPSTFCRWEEESAAIDGHMPHLVMRVLREDILSRWIEAYEKENAPKDEQNKSSTSGTASSEYDASASSSIPAAATAPVQGSQGEGSGSGVAVGTQRTRQGETTPGAITVPNPSDEATPSSHSPRDQNSVVDQLRSGLRQVADALAQTVAAVRSTREQILQNRETAGATASGGGGEVSSSSGADNDNASQEVPSTVLTQQREGQGEGEEESGRNRTEDMESQNASVAEATGEELTTPMEESEEAMNLGQAPPTTQDEQMQSSQSPVPSPGQSNVCVCVRVCVCVCVCVCPYLSTMTVPT